MKFIQLTTLALVTMIGIGVVAGVSDVSAAIDPKESVRLGVTEGGGDPADDGSALPGFIQDIVNVLLYVIGAVAVIMLVLGGIRYTTSNGDSNQVTAAKNTIMYAIIGIVVAILAYAIVNFVISAF